MREPRAPARVRPRRPRQTHPTIQLPNPPFAPSRHCVNFPHPAAPNLC